MNKCIYCKGNINDGFRGRPNRSNLCTKCFHKRYNYQRKMRKKIRKILSTNRIETETENLNTSNI
jgi:hypothetical protein